jgi:hypothetical protein
LFVAVTFRIPALFAKALDAGASTEAAIRPNLTVVLELASLASRDRGGYRTALSSLLEGLVVSLIDAGRVEQRQDAEMMVSGLLGCVVMALGGRVEQDAVAAATSDVAAS